MKTNANQTTSTIYYRPLKQWIEVTPEQKRDWERFVGATRKAKQRAGACCIPYKKSYKCDGLCDTCEFRCIPKDAPQHLSIDTEMANAYENGVSRTSFLADSRLTTEIDIDSLILNGLLTELDRCTVDKYALATDHGGQVFYSQAVENQKELFVGEAASALKKNIKQMEEGHQKGEEYQNEEQKADEEYQRAQAAQMEEKKRQESEKENAEKQEESDTDIKETEAVQAKVENPLDQIKKIKSMGILGLVLKDGTVVSDKTIERKNLPSERNLQKGSLLVNEISADPVSEVIFLNYLQKHFQCAVDEGGKHQKGSKEHSLSYELEYIIGGQKSDRENLKKTVNRILLIREGMNYATLAKSAKMRGEAMALAAAITGAAALPEFAGALQKLLMLAWAYGESLLDVRTLLAKGKVPMLKAETEWKLPLEKLGMLAEVLKECDAGGGNGQSYEDYLSGLLILGKKQQRNLRVLDLIECNRRMEKGGETFRVDALVAQAEASADFELAPVFLRVPAVWMHVRNQGTAYTIKGQYGYGQP